MLSYRGNSYNHKSDKRRVIIMFLLITNVNCIREERDSKYIKKKKKNTFPSQSTRLIKKKELIVSSIFSCLIIAVINFLNRVGLK